MGFTTLLEKLHIIKPKVEEDEQTKRLKELNKLQKKRYNKRALAPNMMGTCFMSDTILTEEERARLYKKIDELNPRI